MRAVIRASLGAAILTISAAAPTTADWAGRAPDDPGYFTAVCCGDDWDPSDVRLAGIWEDTEDWSTLSYAAEGGDAVLVFDLGWGDVRIDGEEGDWEGTYRYFTRVDDETEVVFAAELAGTDAYVGMSALAIGVAEDGPGSPVRLEGVIYPTETVPEGFRSTQGSKG